MHDNDFLKWRKFDGLGPAKRPSGEKPKETAFTPLGFDGYPRNASFEERLTFEDKLFLESVGISR